MKTIPLTQGKVTIVDDEDFNELNKYKWYALVRFGIWYAMRNSKMVNGKRRTGISMHQQITSFKYKEIDHINRNGLDNRKCNLRSCTGSQNQKNSKLRIDNKSGLRGVCWRPDIKKWQAYINKDKKKKHLGYFNDKEEAGHIVDKNAKELFGEFAVMNFQKGE